MNTLREAGVNNLVLAAFVTTFVVAIALVVFRSYGDE